MRLLTLSRKARAAPGQIVFDGGIGGRRRDMRLCNLRLLCGELLANLSQARGEGFGEVVGLLGGRLLAALRLGDQCLKLVHAADQLGGCVPVLGEIGFQHRDMLPLDLNFAHDVARGRFFALRKGLIGLLIPLRDLLSQPFDFGGQTLFFVERLVDTLAHRRDLADRTLAGTQWGHATPPGLAAGQAGQSGSNQNVEFIE